MPKAIGQEKTMRLGLGWRQERQRKRDGSIQKGECQGHRSKVMLRFLTGATEWTEERHLLRQGPWQTSSWLVGESRSVWKTLRS